MSEISASSRPSVLGGAMIIAGTAVGAGMFSIPMVTSGVWFSGSIVMLVYTWFCLLMSGLMILEVNLQYPLGASFHTITKDLLGNSWSVINGLSIAFVLYILTYAYISAGSSIIVHNFSGLLRIPNSLACLFFALLVGFCVWLSTRAVDRFNTILIGGMVISFVLAIGGLFAETELANLFNTTEKDPQYLPYALAALPYLLTAFGYHGNVPSLVKYYNKDAKSVAQCLLIGTLIALIIYIIWQLVIQGNIPRIIFKQISAEGGNIDSLLKHLDINTVNKNISFLLNLFSYMAIASSFLGVTLGLLDYVADFFKITDDRIGRLKSASITFVLPALLAIIFPNGFLYAIGFAGLAATIWAAIVPALMVRASRLRTPLASYQAPGGFFMIFFVIAFGVINAATHILANLNFLPIYE